MRRVPEGAAVNMNTNEYGYLTNDSKISASIERTFSALMKVRAESAKYVDSGKAN
jgi:hypothetical protein